MCSDAKDLGDVHRHRNSRATNVGRTLYKRYGAVAVYCQVDR